MNIKPLFKENPTYMYFNLLMQFLFLLQGLDSVMKLELIQDKSPEEIEKVLIWTYKMFFINFKFILTVMYLQY